MSSCKYLILLLTVAGIIGCKSTSNESQWAGQKLLRGWHDQIKGSKIPTGYRSPAGSFEVNFPISNSHVFINDFVDKGEKQRFEVRVRELVSFRDHYGYDTKVITMLASECPDIEKLEYEWVARKLPDIVAREPDTDNLRHHETYGPWRIFTFGPYISTRDQLLYRIEAFFVYQEMVFRVISYNNIVSERIQKITGISKENAEEMSIESTNKHFDQFIQNLVLIGRDLTPDPKEELQKEQPGSQPNPDSEQQTDPDLLAISF